MSTTPVLTVPFITPNPLGLIADGYQMSPMLANVAEPLAQHHWLFGTDNPGMTDLITGAAATCSSGAPTMNAGGYLTPPATGANYINSGIADAANQTICGVYQQNTGSGNRGLMGAWHQGGGVGAILFSTAGASIAFDMGASAKTPAPTQPNVTNGSWFFVAKVSVSATANGLVAGEHIYWGNGSVLIAYDYATVKTLDGTVNVGWAGSADGASLTNPSNLAEGIVFGSALTPFQVLGVYARSKARVTARGPAVI